MTTQQRRTYETLRATGYSGTVAEVAALVDDTRLRDRLLAHAADTGASDRYGARAYALAHALTLLRRGTYRAPSAKLTGPEVHFLEQAGARIAHRIREELRLP